MKILKFNENKFSGIENEFNSLNSKEQWKWLLEYENKKDFFIELDNDTTFITFTGEDLYLTFKADIGNREGVTLLLESLGFEVRSV